MKRNYTAFQCLIINSIHWSRKLKSDLPFVISGFLTHGFSQL